MDQPNPNTPHDPNDITFNVMPAEGKNLSGSSANFKPSTPPPPHGGVSSVSYSSAPAPSSRKWIYIVIGIIVLAALGGVAYYMLGNKSDNSQQQAVTTKLPKVWLTQYFNSETCTDQKTCGDDADPENDGLKNYDEFKAGTNPLNPDTDQDGLADGDEVNIYKTEPTLKYTDRREVVAQNNWTDGYQIKNGYDPLTPALPFTDARKKQIADDTAKYKLHEPSISTTTSASQAPASSVDTSNWKTLVNNKYSFQVQYPPDWAAETVKGNEDAGAYLKLATETKTCYVLNPAKNLPSGCAIMISIDTTGNGDLSYYDNIAKQKNPITVGGKAATEYITPDQTSIVILSMDKTFIIISDTSTTYSSIFHSVVSSFKFTK